jgi:hypothetical protein
MYVRRRGRGFGGLGATAGVATIAATIQQIEGYYPGSLAYTNNNPGNLIYLPSSSIQSSNGATPGASGFAAFPTYQDGLNALYAQIQAYGTQGLTISQMMAKYAPATDANGNPTGNNPTAYANSIASSLGVSPDTPVAAAISGSSGGDVYTADTGDWWTTDITQPLDTDLSDLSSDLSDSGGDSGSSGVDPVLLAGGVVLAALALYAFSV